MHGRPTLQSNWKSGFLTNVPRTPQYHRSYWTTWIATLLFFSSYYALLVPFPVYLAGLGIADWEVAVILGSSAIASLVIRPLSGILSDFRERRQVMLLGVMALAAGANGVASTTQTVSLLGFRVVQAAGYVVFTTAATATIADLAQSQKRANAFAVYGIAANVAISLIPILVTSSFFRIHVLGAFLLSGALAGVSGVVVLAVRPIPGSSSVVRHGWREFLRIPYAIRVPMIAAILFGVGFGTFLQFLPLLAAKRGLGGIGLAYAVYGLGIILTRLLAGHLLDGRRRDGAILGAMIAMSVGLFAFAFAYSNFTLLFGACLIALGSGILHPALIAIHVERMPTKEYGRATASFYLAFDLGIGLGAWALSPALQWWGIVGLFAAAAVLNGSGLLIGKRLTVWRRG